MGAEKVYRVQSPLKVQPNEVDGCYVYVDNGLRVLLAVEAKSKGSDVLLKHQIYGSAGQALMYFGDSIDVVRPVGVKIQRDNTVLVVTFEAYNETNQKPKIDAVYEFTLSQIPLFWQKRRVTKSNSPQSSLDFDYNG